MGRDSKRSTLRRRLEDLMCGVNATVSVLVTTTLSRQVFHRWAFQTVGIGYILLGGEVEGVAGSFIGHGSVQGLEPAIRRGCLGSVGCPWTPLASWRGGREGRRLHGREHAAAPGAGAEHGRVPLPGGPRGLVEVVSDVIVQVDLYGRRYASFAEVRGMAVVVVGWWCLRSRVLVRVVVGVLVRVVVVGMVMFMVMRVAMRSHVHAGVLTNMSALVGRVFAVLDLRRVICGLQGCLAIVVQNARRRWKRSAMPNTTSSPSSFVSYHQCR